MLIWQIAAHPVLTGDGPLLLTGSTDLSDHYQCSPGPITNKPTPTR